MSALPVNKRDQMVEHRRQVNSLFTWLRSSNSPSPLQPFTLYDHKPLPLPLSPQTSHEPIISFWGQDRHPHFPRESRAWMQKRGSEDPAPPYPGEPWPVHRGSDGLSSLRLPTLHSTSPPIISIVLPSFHKSSTPPLSGVQGVGTWDVAIGISRLWELLGVRALFKLFSRLVCELGVFFC